MNDSRFREMKIDWLRMERDMPPNSSPMQDKHIVVIYRDKKRKIRTLVYIERTNELAKENRKRFSLNTNIAPAIDTQTPIRSPVFACPRSLRVNSPSAKADI